jgi:Aerolysin toxin
MMMQTANLSPLSLKLLIGAAIAATSLATASCRSRTQSDQSSPTAAADKSPQQSMEHSLRNWQGQIIKHSGQELAQIAFALGYGWPGGCQGGIGEDMRSEWSNDGKTTALRSNYDGSGACGPGNQAPDRRLNIVYHWDDPNFKKLDIHMDKKRAKGTKLATLYNMVAGWAPVESKITLNITRTATDTVTAMRTDILRESGELTMEFSTGILGFGQKTTAKVTIGGEHQFTKTSTTTETETFGLSRDIILPPNRCLVVAFERLEEEYLVPYTAFIELNAQIEFQGFMRAHAAGGNFHRLHRDKDNRPDVNYVFGSPNGTPFWEAILAEKNANTYPWLWKEVYANKEDFDHGAVINSAIQNLSDRFVSQQRHIFNLNGYFSVVKGGQVKSTLRMIPNSDPTCAKAGNRTSDVIR